MLRTDEFATLYLFHPLRKWISSSKGRIPILMYHSVSDTAENAKHPYYRTVTTPDSFAQQMRFLHENAYSVLDLDEALTLMQRPQHSCARVVVITFDDGFQDFHRNAFPILNRYGFGATVFLPTAYIGKSVREFKGAKCLTWNEVRELRKAGIQFGSHTVTHPQLKSVKAADVRYEVQFSKQTIEDELGEPVRSFAYPFAFPEGDRAFTRGLRGMLQESGYKNGVCTIIGTADRVDDNFFMRRLPVNSYDGPRLFQAKLDGGYDWLHAMQYTSKLMDRFRSGGNVDT